jgi:hypothetical protein
MQAFTPPAVKAAEPAIKDVKKKATGSSSLAARTETKFGGRLGGIADQARKTLLGQ